MNLYLFYGGACSCVRCYFREAEQVNVFKLALE
jgi:hypothetical protein